MKKIKKESGSSRIRKGFDIENHVDALDKLHECKCQVDFLREIFRGGGQEFFRGTFPKFQAAEGLFYFLDRIGKEMQECLDKLSLRKKAA